MDHRYKKFLALAETGSFSLAAKKLHVSQPAITLAIASLERAFGAKLYVRKKQPVTLTQQGVIVADASKKISLEVEKMRAKLGQESTGAQYQIGIIDSIAQLLYASSKESTILTDIEVMVDNSRRIINELLAGKIDAGLITGQPRTLDKELTIHKLHNEEFVFVCAPHRAPKKAVTEINDWLAFNQDSTTYKHFTKLFKHEGLHIEPVFYSTSMEILKEMAIAGKGTALLPLHIVQQSIYNETLVIVPTKPLYRPIWAVTRKNNDSDKIIHSVTVHIDTLLTNSRLT